MLNVTATNLPRLMVCNGSRLMESSTHSIKQDNTVRDEGNAAHWLVEQVHAGHFTAEELIDRKAPNGVYITAEMVEHLEDYMADASMGGIEVSTSHGTPSWQINGRADSVSYVEAQKHLDIGDLKYGWSIVEPEDNWTLISHALGWIQQNPDKPVESITFTIYQPRPYHPEGRVRSWTIETKELDALWDRIATTLTDPSDMLQTSPQCTNCPALATCPAARRAQMNGIEASEQAFNDELDNDELSFQIDQVSRAIEVLKQQEKAYKDLAQHKIRQGEIVNNYALNQDLANTSWLSCMTPEFLQNLTGKDLVGKKVLVTPNQAIKKGVSKEVVAIMTERRVKGVKLVRMDANTKAKKMFNPN